MSTIVKTALQYLLQSLLIPWVLKNIDSWTTIMNKKVTKFLEKEENVQ